MSAITDAAVRVQLGILGYDLVTVLFIVHVFFSSTDNVKNDYSIDCKPCLIQDYVYFLFHQSK